MPVTEQKMLVDVRSKVSIYCSFETFWDILFFIQSCQKHPAGTRICTTVLHM